MVILREGCPFLSSMGRLPLVPYGSLFSAPMNTPTASMLCRRCPLPMAGPWQKSPDLRFSQKCLFFDTLPDQGFFFCSTWLQIESMQDAEIAERNFNNRICS